MRPTDHERNEWRRFAQALLACGNTVDAQWYNGVADLDEITVDAYDLAQGDYRAWLMDGTLPKGG